MTARSCLTRVAVLGVAAVAMLVAGCAPLPGGSLDPVYLKSGLSRGTEPAPTAPSQPATAPPSTPTATPAPRTRAPAPGTSVWSGRYRDSRGEGDITLTLAEKEGNLSGTWKLRTGGGGPITATLDGASHRMTVRMQNASSECPATLDGWIEIGNGAIVGAYHGQDCAGPVTDGRLDLH